MRSLLFEVTDFRREKTGGGSGRVMEETASEGKGHTGENDGIQKNL
jgi:hypothetical protein